MYASVSRLDLPLDMPLDMRTYSVGIRGMNATVNSTNHCVVDVEQI